MTARLPSEGPSRPATTARPGSPKAPRPVLAMAPATWLYDHPLLLVAAQAKLLLASQS